MFEEIVEKKYKPLKAIADELKVVSPDTIKNSELPLYALKFLSAEQTEINDREVLNTLLEKSVKLIVNYSLRPKWTIVNYLFGGFDSKPADEILRKTEVFRFYRYYVDLISNHIKDNALMFITPEEVNYLTDEANKVVLDKLVNKTSSVKIKNFFSQVYKLKYGDDKEINLDWSVPFLFIKLFLEDKGFQELLDKFKIIPGLDDTMEIEMKTAIKVLTNKYYVNDDFFVLKDASQNIKSEVSEPKGETPEAKSEISNVKIDEPETGTKGPDKKSETPIVKKEKNVDEEILDTKKSSKETEELKIVEDDKPKGIIRIIKNIPTKRFHKGKKIAAEETIPALKEEPKEKEAEESVTEETLIRKRVRGGGEDKIKHIFKGEEIKAIQKKIFKDSKTSMYEAFDELENFNSWREASGFLKELFLKNKVSLYNKWTVLFVDLLSDYFSKIEKGK